MCIIYAAALDDQDDADGCYVVCEYTLPLATALAAKLPVGVENVRYW